MSFCHVTLTVKDMEASLRFYTETVRLPVVKRFQAGPDTEIAFLGAGETKVELICGKNCPEAIVGNGISIGFEVEDVPTKFQALKSGGIHVISDIIQPNPHARFFYIADPDGFRVQLMENR